MARDLAVALRELCLSYPESDEVRSHGAANFRVRGKTLAIYQINHHGDGPGRANCSTGRAPSADEAAPRSPDPDPGL